MNKIQTSLITSIAIGAFFFAQQVSAEENMKKNLVPEHSVFSGRLPHELISAINSSTSVDGIKVTVDLVLRNELLQGKERQKPECWMNGIARANLSSESVTIRLDEIVCEVKNRGNTKTVKTENIKVSAIAVNGLPVVGKVIDMNAEASAKVNYVQHGESVVETLDKVAEELEVQGIAAILVKPNVDLNLIVWKEFTVENEHMREKLDKFLIKN